MAMAVVPHRLLVTFRVDGIGIGITMVTQGHWCHPPKAEFLFGSGSIHETVRRVRLVAIKRDIFPSPAFLAPRIRVENLRAGGTAWSVKLLKLVPVPVPFAVSLTRTVVYHAVKCKQGHSCRYHVVAVLHYVEKAGNKSNDGSDCETCDKESPRHVHAPLHQGHPKTPE